MNIRSVLLAVFLSATMAASALTDQQVIEYIKQQTAAGKSEKQIGKELLAKGVTPEQAKRIKAKYEASKNATVLTGSNAPANGGKRLRQTVKEASANIGTSHEFDEDGVSSAPTVVFEQESVATAQKATSGKQVYGRDVFNAKALTFEPNDNQATPQNYRLGPGDEVIIDVWGNSEAHIRQTISPEGSIMIDQIGPVYLNGLTINDANKHVKGVFSKKYGGLTDEETDIQVTLGQVRTIQIDILGEVSTPGTYRLSPFSTVFHGLYNAGGINEIGSLRNIQVLRNGKKIAGVDIYDYLFNGKTGGNIRLQEGDIIIVPPYSQLVSVQGNVKRPMYYEVKTGESVKSVLDYAGGFTGDAYSGMVRLSRASGNENELFNIERGDFASYRLKDGDVITIGTILDRYANRVQVEGAVFRPGEYAIGKEIRTVKDLVKAAEGLTEDAYSGRVLLYREGQDKRLEVIPLDLGMIMAGTAADIELKRNDSLIVASVLEIEKRGNFYIGGMVATPGEYPYVANTTVEDLILQAGGLLEGASTARVDIARRIVDPSSTEQTSRLSQVFTVDINSGLDKKDGSGFVLKPFDRVEVRKAPGYAVQRTVKVDGEVLFDGNYTLQRRNERISDVIKRAGGIVDGAYVKGASLQRRLTESEFIARKETLRLAMSQSTHSADSIAMSKIEIADTYNVGIDLEKALANPGSTFDLVLEPGDNIYVPQLQSTVKISGEVLFPNSVVYEEGKSLKHYIDMAGGYGQRAKKKHVFVVYLNGTVAKGKKNTPIEPGCSIIVPMKPNSSGTDWAKILTMATSFSSVATMAATVANVFKK